MCKAFVCLFGTFNVCNNVDHLKMNSNLPKDLIQVSNYDPSKVQPYLFVELTEIDKQSRFVFLGSTSKSIQLFTALKRVNRVEFCRKTLQIQSVWVCVCAIPIIMTRTDRFICYDSSTNLQTSSFEGQYSAL